MSDLISRNKAISVLEQLNEHSLNGKMDISNAIYLLENQKISYDVGKVISELEQNSVGITFPSHPDDEVQFIPIDRAVEIVKQGGVGTETDDYCEWSCTDSVDILAKKRFWKNRISHTSRSRAKVKGNGADL